MHGGDVNPGVKACYPIAHVVEVYRLRAVIISRRLDFQINYSFPVLVPILVMVIVSFFGLVIGCIIFLLFLLFLVLMRQ